MRAPHADFAPGLKARIAGVYCLLIGGLVIASRLLPRFVGVLMLCGGLGWMTYLFPPLSTTLYPYNLAPGLVGEWGLTLCLLVSGTVLKERQAI